MSRKIKNSLLLLIILALLPNLAAALDSDRSAPVHITADYVLVNRNTGINMYRGNVIAIEGTSELTGDLVYTYSNKANQITKMIAYGKQSYYAHFNTIPQKGQSKLYTKARIIQYYPQEKIAYLITDAHAKQNQNTFQGPFLEYNMASEVISSRPSKNERSTIVIQNQNANATNSTSTQPKKQST